jgi:hypothetical protein
MSQCNMDQMKSAVATQQQKCLSDQNPKYCRQGQTQGEGILQTHSCNVSKEQAWGYCHQANPHSKGTAPGAAFKRGCMGVIEAYKSK